MTISNFTGTSVMEHPRPASTPGKPNGAVKYDISQCHPGVKEDSVISCMQTEYTDGDLTSNDEAQGISRKDKLRTLKAKTKAKTKALLHIDRGEPLSVEADRENGGALSGVLEDPAFHPTEVSEEAKQQAHDPRSPLDKTKGRLETIGGYIAHPRTSIKNKVEHTTAGTLSDVQRPQLSQGGDQDLLEAHIDLADAKDIRAYEDASSDKDKANADIDHSKVNIAWLEGHRDSMRVAWTTRHVYRARVVRKDFLPVPEKEKFVERNENGKVVGYNRIKWLGFFILYHTQNFTAQYIDDFDELPFDIDSLRDNVERIIIASAPWQKWLMDVRMVYRWEDPKRTMRWLVVYMICWYYDILVGFVCGYIVYLVVRGRYSDAEYQSLHESNRRATQREDTVYNLGELMHKHGRKNWLEPLLEELGPSIQLQVGDVANIMEVFANFYSWKSPLNTFYSLIFFTSVLLVSLFTDTRYCMKGFWLAVGGLFFVFWPISSRYPKYRYLVSPFKWIFWDIPTDAEWSFSYLAARAQTVLKDTVTQMTADKDLSLHTSPASSTELVPAGPTPLLAFRAIHQGHVGKLLIYPDGLRFVRTSTLSSNRAKEELFNIRFADISEVRKIDRAASKMAKASGMLPRKVKESGEDLEILWSWGHEGGQIGGEDVILIGSVAGRDEAFNALIAFSGLRWQSLQSGPGKKGNGRNSGDDKGKGLLGDTGTMGIG